MDDRTPQRPLHRCNATGCCRLTRERYCEEHRGEDDKTRGTAAQRGYGGRWRKARRAFLASNPLCAECLRHGRITAATVVDHVLPHKGNEMLFWDTANWQALCGPCHSAKTARGE